jgi:hypothetical protein
VAGLLILVLVGAVLVAYMVDRGLKTRARANRLREMSDRLDSAAVRAEEQQEKRQAVAQASSALTSFMPAINQPPLSVPDIWQSASATREPGEQQEQPVQQEHPAQEQPAELEPAAQAEQTAELEAVGQETAGWQERTARLELPGQPERDSGHAGHRPARPGAHPSRPADRATQR